MTYTQNLKYDKKQLGININKNDETLHVKYKYYYSD